MKKIISFMHLSLDGFITDPNGEMNGIKVDEEIFDHAGKRIGKGDTVQSPSNRDLAPQPVAAYSVSRRTGSRQND